MNRMMRWDPSSRAGAVAIRAKSRYDVQEIHEAIADWASYQNLGGDLDHIETSPVAGNYDWKGYLLEESKLAQERTAKRASAKPARPAPTPDAAPSTYYA